MNKTCSVCGCVKNIREFFKRTKSKDGLSPSCKGLQETAGGYKWQYKEEIYG